MTPESSRSRGDWGLKRPIPRKVDSKYLRFSNIDTMEHRTTFESSHDTVMTAKKWQEMGVPLKVNRVNRDTSAFHIDGLPESVTKESYPYPEALRAQIPHWGIFYDNITILI